MWCEMAFEEISPAHRRYPRAAAVAVTAVDLTEPALPVDPHVEAEFVCEACRRELPLSDRSRVKSARCRACA
jgi:hypothetical protein